MINNLITCSMVKLAGLHNFTNRLKDEQRGAATAEYALILALVVVALMAVLTDLQDALVTRINEIITELAPA